MTLLRQARGLAPAPSALGLGLIMAAGACDPTEAELIRLPTEGLGGEGGAMQSPSDGPLGEATSFQVQLTGPLDLSVAAELFVVDANGFSAEELDALHDQGALVACYFSAGSFEPWRPDADDFPEAALGQPLAEFPDERWVDVTNETVVQLMEARVLAAATRGCDGVYPSVVRPGAAEETGFSLSSSDYQGFARELAAAAQGASVWALYAGGASYDGGAAGYAGAIVTGCIAEGSCGSWLNFPGPRFFVEMGNEADPEGACGDPGLAGPVIVKTPVFDAFRYVCL